MGEMKLLFILTLNFFKERNKTENIFNNATWITVKQHLLLENILLLFLIFFLLKLLYFVGTDYKWSGFLSDLVASLNLCT